MLSKLGRKHCGKSRNCLLRAISPFPTIFSKDLYCRHVKTRLVWESVNKLIYTSLYKGIAHSSLADDEILKLSILKPVINEKLTLSHVILSFKNPDKELF